MNDWMLLPLEMPQRDSILGNGKAGGWVLNHGQGLQYQ